MSAETYEIRLAHLQITVDTMKTQLGTLTEIPVQLSSLNTTLKILGMVFVLLLPIACTWNYYLGNVLTAQGIRVSVLEVQLANARDEIRALKQGGNNGVSVNERTVE